MKNKPSSLDGFQIVDADGYPSDADFHIDEPITLEYHDYPEFTENDSYIHLVAETIKGALEDLLDEDPEVRKEAREWFKSEDNRPPSDAESAINYLWICDLFGIDANWLRKKLLDFAEEHARQKATKQKKNPGPIISMLRQALLNGKKETSKPETVHGNQ